MSAPTYNTTATSRPFRVVLWMTCVFLSTIGRAAATESIGRIQFLGEARLEKNLAFDGAPIGGLSGITYDSRTDTYFVISDDPGILSPARYFTLKIDLLDGALGSGDIVVKDVTYLKSKAGGNFPSGSIDGEGIAFTAQGTFMVSSEGQAKELIDPFIREFQADGTHLRSLRVPKKYLPKRRMRSGVRHNLAFESLTLSPGGEFLFTATENALIQDGPESDIGVRSPSRILRYDTASGRLLEEYLYLVDAVAHAPLPSDGFRVNGLVDLLGLDDNTLLALERSFSTGIGNEVRLYLVQLKEATNIRQRKRLKNRISSCVPAHKELLLDFTELGTDLDNFEGLTWGPTLIDGRRTIVLVADDNFNPAYQVTQFFAFAVDFNRTSISTVQGPDHRSPLESSWVRGVSGVVTARETRPQGETTLWIQDSHGDLDSATADGVAVVLKHPVSAPDISIGSRVSISGRVIEAGLPGDLSVTRIIDADVQIAALEEPLPLPVPIGLEGRQPPTDHVDDDGLSSFQPASDAIDFFESLEGMRVALHDPVVVGPTSRFGEFTVVTDRGLYSSPRSAAGGVLIEAGDTNPEKVIIKPGSAAPSIQFNVGDRFLGPIIGVVDYAFGNFRVLVSEPLPRVLRRSPQRPPRASENLPGAFTFATFNVDNLSAQSDAEKFRRLAEIAVENLQSPALIALQEMQDNSGPEDDGTVAADQTFARLIKAISDIGGPSYEYAQIDPLDGLDGGRPGGNIRTGYLFDQNRLRFSGSQNSEPRAAAKLVLDEKNLTLLPNPGLIGTSEPAFNEDLDAGYQPSRKPLVAEFWYGPHQIFAINVHLKSKRGDQPLFGETQPPQRASELQRTLQTQVIADFVAPIFDLNPQANIIVLGDFNDHEFRSTVEPLRRVGLENLIERVPARERYTYVYNGNSEVLDQVFVSPHLLEIGNPEIVILHVNADFSARARASDHDPVLVRMTVEKASVD